jgi:hypothetical protein
MYHGTIKVKGIAMAQEGISQGKDGMVALGCGSARMDDDTFVAEVENCRFPGSAFRHADHVRLAWTYIRNYGYETAERRMRESIRRFATHLAAEGKYHETITVVWMRLVGAAFERCPKLDSFIEFTCAHPWLLDKQAVFEFYTRDRLMSDLARRTWVEPDLKPLPQSTVGQN